MANEMFDCDNHNPVQHRDGRSPWCDACGLTANGLQPVDQIKGSDKE